MLGKYRIGPLGRLVLGSTQCGGAVPEANTEHLNRGGRCFITEKRTLCCGVCTIAKFPLQTEDVGVWGSRVVLIAE